RRPADCSQPYLTRWSSLHPAERISPQGDPGRRRAHPLGPLRQPCSECYEDEDRPSSCSLSFQDPQRVLLPRASGTTRSLLPVRSKQWSLAILWITLSDSVGRWSSRRLIGKVGRCLNET